MEQLRERVEPSAEADRWAREAIGAAIEVHRHLGPGFLEEVYEEALAVEMTLRGIPFERQLPVAVSYKGHDVGGTKLDFLVGGSLVVELKAVDVIGQVHLAQLLSYLKATRLRLGLLINFNVPALKDGVRRMVLS
jgi:GxxExxY protein